MNDPAKSTSFPDETTARAGFLTAHPAFEGTVALDDLRARDYARLDAHGHTYLDYTGAGLYGQSQIDAHARLLTEEVLGNPHSASLTSAATTRLVEDVRRRVLAYFGASADEYTAIFTANATGAIKHVAESYPFAPGGRLLLTVDNHNSMNGIREFARARGAAVTYAPLTTPDLRLDLDAVHADLAPVTRGTSLLAFPAQSNFSGVKHPLDLVDRAHAAGWDVLLDAAAFVPTNRLDLGTVHPDFVSVSFYKMFGYPTGVGCLLARREALARLRRPWFAGGTVNFATVRGDAHVLAPGEAGFEDGTLNYLAIPAVAQGLDHLERAGLDRVGTRVACLTAWLLEALLALRHDNGRHMVRIYGPTTTAARGGTIAFNCYDPDGHLLDYRRIDELASAARISIRSGCFCNPGVGETAENLTDEDMRAGLSDRDITLPRFLRIIQHRSGKSAGALRVSLGLASNFADVHRFARFAASLRNQSRLAIGEVTFDIESCRVIRDGA